MSMLTSISKSAGQDRPVRCPVGKFKADNPDLAEDLDEAIVAKAPDGAFVVTGVDIANYLNSEYGFKIRPAAVRNHRREDCACPQ